VDYAVDIQGLIYRWPGNTDFSLNIANWQIKTGEKVFLYGQSGSGKSTFLNLVSAVMPANQGKLCILGQELTILSASQRDAFRANNIGMIFQQFNLLPFLSGRQNIELAGLFTPKNKTGSVEALAAITEKLGLSAAVLNQQASQMSVGQQQRIAIARALLLKPPLIIADEPTSALDSELRDEFIQLLLTNSLNSTVIFVSHDKGLAKHFDQSFDLAHLQSRGVQGC
jgi:putative ABC transport system ATP-binding protein